MEPAPEKRAGIFEMENLELAGVVHDVNQMLAVVIGRAGLLLRRGPGDRWEENLRAVELAARDAAAMLSRVSGSTAGRPPGEVSCASLRETATEAGILITPRGEVSWGTEADSVWSLANEIPAGLSADLPAQVVREVLNNLLLNSLEAAPDGVRIRISGAVRENRALLTFADDGPGLPESARAKLFQPGPSTSGLPGRGLGLAACRKLLLGWGGEMRLAESRGPGAVFELDLPRGGSTFGAQGAVSQPAGEPTEGVTPGHSRRSILIVDDELAVREMLGEVMAELGCDVALAKDAAQALEVFAPGTLDVVFLDQSLPGMQGDELAGLLREMDSAVAIVLASGWGREKMLGAVDPGHVDLTAVKPLEMSKMVDLLAEGAALADRRRAAGGEDGNGNSQPGREAKR